MAKQLVVCLLVLSSCCLGLGLEDLSGQNACLQLNRLFGLEPDHRIKNEAGYIETWNPNNKQHKCAGVALSRSTIESKGLRLPFYANAPQLFYIQKGRGVFGTVFPGCAETFHQVEQQQQQQQQGGSRQSFRDFHQRIRHFKEGDLIAVPTGIAFWMYNYAQEPVISISLLYTNSHHNQLDEIPRRFYIASNSEQEFAQYQQQPHQQQKEEMEEEGHNVFKGFNEEFLAEVFKIDTETARKLQGHDDKREGGIAKVEGDLGILTPSSWEKRSQEQEEQEPQEQREKSRRSRESQSGNGLEETICSMKLTHNLGRSKYPDIFVSRAGGIKTANVLDFPVLGWLGLSAEYGVLYKNAMYVPHYTINANTLIYVTKGSARLQVVECSGKSVFDEILEAGQLLMVPQNFALAMRAENEEFEYVSFKTNERAMMATLAGRTSILRGLPEEVVAHSYQLKTTQASQLKNNNPYVLLVPPMSSPR